MKKLFFILFFVFIWSGSALAGQRYISLAPSTTEILFALGLDEEIAAVSTFCNYPKEVKEKPRVGDFSRPNIEKILSLKPDYIFSTGLEQNATVNHLRRLNFKVLVSDPQNIAELFESIRQIGKITGRNDEARELIKRMRDDIESVAVITRKITREKRIKVFLEIWHSPLMTAGKGSFIDELIALAGGNNIAHDISRPYSNFSAEKVVKLNPGCIILAYMDKESPRRLIENRFGWQDIDAVKNKRVFNDINPDILLRPGPRITQGLKELYKRFYK